LSYRVIELGTPYVKVIRFDNCENKRQDFIFNISFGFSCEGSGYGFELNDVLIV
jgi:hypothetical protein